MAYTFMRTHTYAYLDMLVQLHTHALIAVHIRIHACISVRVDASACLLMRIYRGDCCCHEDHAEEGVRSYFRINYQAIQVFEGIRSQLWAPGFSGAAMAMELLRNVFW